MEEEEILLKEFEQNGHIFKYDFAEISILQTSLGREVSEFKATQKSTQPSSFEQVLKSRGAEWLPILGSYILNEYKDGVKVPFSLDRAKTNEEIIGTFTGKAYTDLEVCAKHFFRSLGLHYLISILFGDEKNSKSSSLEILLKTMEMMNLTQNSAQLLNTSENVQSAMKKPNSKKG